MFDVFKFPDVPRRRRAAARAAFTDAKQALDYFDLKIGSGVALSPLSDQSRRFLRRIRRAPAPHRGFPLSSRHVREAAAIANIETLLLYVNDNKFLRSGYQRLRMLSNCLDIGLVDIAQSNFPTERTKLTIRRAMQGKQLQGFGMLDLALFSPGRGFAEDRAHIHSHHAFFFDNGQKLLLKDWKRLLAPVSGNVNALGGPIVYISPQDRELSTSRVAGLGYYISKESCGANTMYDGEDGQKSECSFTDWTFNGALRRLEFWSYIDARDACWGTGELGAEMRLHWRKRFLSLLDYDELPLESRVDVDAIHAGWTRIWRELNVGFAPIEPKSMFARRAPKKAAAADAEDDW